jgi:hypothetical protein
MYAVLQTSLEQSIDRETLEEAIMATEGLAKPDCAQLQKELFGIIAAGLSQDDALALQAALQARNVPTEAVDASVLPVLPLPRRVQALKFVETGIVLVDLYDRETSYEWQHTVFAAGGGLLHLRSIQDQKLETVPGGRGAQKAIIITGHHYENLPEFRLELFLPVESPRVQWVLTKDSVIIADDRHLRLRDGEELARLLSRLGSALAPEQVNTGIKKVMAGEEFVYPSVHAFEEEIIWSLYQLMRGST